MSSNPFISVTENDSEYLTANCSLNRVRIAKLPIYGIEDDIEGKQMSEIFGAGIIINEIERNAEALGINLSEHKRMDLPILLDEKIDEGNQEAIDVTITRVENLSAWQFEKNTLSEKGEATEVQTKRLYHIAESFIQTVSDLM